MSDTKGIYFAVKRLEIHDGPGVRTTLFLKGCPLHCQWCHNPEGISLRPQLAHYAHKCINCGNCVTACKTGAHIILNGKHAFIRGNCIACGACQPICPEKANKLFGVSTDAGQILSKLMLDKPFYDETGGGVTVSGGEPLMQIEFLSELLPLLRAEGIHTAIDTSLYAPRKTVETACSLADLMLCDIKAIDPELHMRLTGVSSEPILDNFRYLSSVGFPIEIRVPVIPGKNDGEIDKIAEFISGLNNICAVKALAYHDLARTKYEALGMDYVIKDVPPVSAEELAIFQQKLENALKK